MFEKKIKEVIGVDTLMGEQPLPPVKYPFEHVLDMEMGEAKKKEMKML